MTFQVKISPKAREVMIKIPKHLMVHQNALRLALHEIGKDVNRETQRLIRTGQRTGRIYIIRGQRHQASAPGEPPANLTGKLAKSNEYKVSGWSTMEVGETAPYAGYLEYGTKKGKIKPRPHLIVAVNNLAVQTINTIERYVHEEISRF